MLAIKQGTMYEAFEKTHFLERPWELSKSDFRLTEAEYSQKQFDGQLIEIDVSEKGDIAKRFLSDLNKQMIFLYADQKETVSNLVHWLDRTIPHIDIPPSESGPFLTALVHYLINDRKFTIDQLCHDKYTLRQKVSAKIDAHRKEANTHAYQALLLPECETPIVVSPDVCFSFSPDEYPYRFLYRGGYKFQKHYYKEVGNLDAKGEEFECAMYLDTLPEVKFWVRNLEQRERHSFWLQTSTDRFYPDFVCMLNDGRYLVVEYKGEDRWTDDDSKEKRVLGELWEKRSNGLCLFVMPKGKDFSSIKAKI